VVRYYGVVQDITAQKQMQLLRDVLYDISTAMVTTTSLHDLLALVRRQLGTLIDTTNFYVALYDEGSGLYTFPYWVDEKETDPDDWNAQDLQGSLTDYVRRKGQAYMFNDDTHHELTDSGEATLVGTWSAEWLGAPLKTQTDVIGVMVVQNYHGEGIYSEGDLQLLAHVAENIARVVQSKQSQDAIHQLVDRMLLLQKIDHAILAAASLETTAQSVITPLKGLLNCQFVMIAMIDVERREVTPLAHPDDLPLQKLGPNDIDLEALHRLSKGHVIAVKDLTQRAPRLAFEDDWMAYGTRAYTIVPMVLEGGLIGAINVGFNEPATLTSEQLQIVTDVASQLSIALRQARLYEQIRSHADRLEKMVAERTAQLHEKAEEMEAFAYSVSHDLRAPLRAMGGFSRILTEGFSDNLPEEAQAHLERISSNASWMGQLIDDLLAFSRIGRHEPRLQAINFNQLVHGVVDELAANDQLEGAKLDIEDLPHGSGDPVLLKQVYFNLITNAIKYAKPQSKAQIHIGAQIAKDTPIVYYIRDRGIGFDMRFSDKLFGVFQRLHEAGDYEGTGIGLATVKRIVTRHGGRVWAEGKVGEGATFYFTLTGGDS